MSDNREKREPAGTMYLEARAVPPPAALSEEARAFLSIGSTTQPSPVPDHVEAWRSRIAERDAASAEAQAHLLAKLKTDVESRLIGGVPVYIATPRAERLLNNRQLLFDIHGGALVYGGGEANVRFTTAAMSLRTGRPVLGIDYRVPPDHPFPAALDDCLTVYRALLEKRPAQQIIVSGVSAGGNLGAALLLRAAEERLAMPEGLMMMTPELDLTESGDTFSTLAGLDTVLTEPLMPINRLYANGADLSHPHLSPLFGDISPFPPTWLQAGTRDLFLSNTVRMHRKLRSCGVRAELHVWDGMPHGGFGGATPEDREISAEMRAFLDTLE